VGDRLGHGQVEVLIERICRRGQWRGLAQEVGDLVGVAIQAPLWRSSAALNYDRAHTGRHTKGRVPADIVFGARKTRTVR
jgi:hypothetical protein